MLSDEILHVLKRLLKILRAFGFSFRTPTSPGQQEEKEGLYAKPSCSVRELQGSLDKSRMFASM